jgi:hypothetical protein
MPTTTTNEPSSTRNALGQLQKGSVINPKGRPKGAVNTLTKDLTSMITQAMSLAGESAKDMRDEAGQPVFPELKDVDAGTAYLYQQARTNPSLFMPLVKQLMPTKIDVDLQLMGGELLELMTQRRDQLAAMRDITPEGDDDADQ